VRPVPARLRVFHAAAELPDPELAPAPSAPPVVCVVVADVLRATTTMIQAFAAGARSARAFPTLDDARVAHAAACRDARSRGEPGPLLCGEGSGLKPPDFDLGNSPREYVPARVGGRDLLVATTNGAPAIARAPRGATVLVAAFTNLSAVVERIARALASSPGPGEAWLVAAGMSGARSPEDDRLIAELAHRLATRVPVEGAWPAPPPFADPAAGLEAFLRATPHGRGLLAVDPSFAGDIHLAATIDAEQVVPEGTNGVIYGDGRRST